jgi:chaperone required for assembly of F1-ATPase
VKRFYKSAGTRAVGGGFEIQLDGRTIKTPLKTPLVVPTAALAHEIAREWEEQAETVQPETMPLTRLANTALDRVAVRKDPVVEEIAAFGQSDLLCYRASTPIELVERQAQAWTPMLRWAEDDLGAALLVTEGIMHVDQPADAVAALTSAVAALDPFRLAGLHTLTTITGSLVLGLAVVAGKLTARDAYVLSIIDETYQAEQWGSDKEAEERLGNREAEIRAAGDFVELLSV